MTAALLELLVMPSLLLLCLFLQACLEQVHTILSAQPACDTAAPACGGVFEPQGLGKHTLSRCGKSSYLNVSCVEKGWVGKGGERKIKKNQIGNDS